MNDIQKNLQSLIELNGALAAALVDSSSGMLLGNVGDYPDIEIAAAANTEVLKAKRRTLQFLDAEHTECIEDILITLKQQYHLLRPVCALPDLFVYYILDSHKANLALARLKLQRVEQKIIL